MQSEVSQNIASNPIQKSKYKNKNKNKHKIKYKKDGPRKNKGNVRSQTPLEKKEVQLIAKDEVDKELMKAAKMMERLSLWPASKQYLEMLLNPFEKDAVRLPDDTMSATALYKSVVSFDLQVNIPDSGYSQANPASFSYLVQPKLGSTVTPNNYKIALLDTSKGWPATYTDPSSYVAMVNGLDPRVDPNAVALTGLPVGSATIIGTMGTTNSNDVYHFVKDTDSYHLKVYNNNSNVTVVNGSKQGIYCASGVYRNTINICTPQSWFSVIPAAWSAKNGRIGVKVRVMDASLTTTLDEINYHIEPSGPGLVSYAYTPGNNGTYLVLDNIVANIDLSTYQAGIAQSLSCLSSAVVITFGFNCTGGVVLVPEFSIPTVSNNSTEYLEYYHTIDTAIYPQWQSTSQNSGAVSSIRPIAMSVLSTCTAPALVQGGNITGALLPPGKVGEYFVPSTYTYELYNQLNSANFANKCTGALSSGNYTVWRQFDQNDYIFRTPSDANDYQYPAIVVSGNLSNTGTQLSPGNYTIGRVIVTTVFEFTTDSNLFPVAVIKGNTVQRDEVRSALMGKNLSMENPLHWGTVKNYFKKGVRLAEKAIPVAGAIASLL